MKNRLVIALVLVIMVFIGGCKSVFELPAGCEDLSVTETPPVVPVGVPVDNAEASVDSQNAQKESANVGTGLKEPESTLTNNEDNLPTKTVVEGDVVSFPNLKAKDADGDKVSYTFTAPLDNSGKWKTKIGDVGDYVVTVTASDGKSKVGQKVKIVVIARNRAPVIEPIADINVNEGDTVRLAPVVSDVEGDKVAVSFSGWMNGDTKPTSFGDAGNYEVTVKANDGTSTSIRKVKVNVVHINRPPVIDKINDVVVKEGDKITVKPSAKDPDVKDVLSYSFSQPLDANGVWQTKVGDAGTYDLNAKVSDGQLEDYSAFKVTVESVNRAPVLTLKEAEINVDEGDVVTVHAEATDSDGDSVKVTYSGWMTENSYKTTFDDGGAHTVTVTATDGINTVSKNVVVTVRNVNRAPVFDAGSFV